MNRNDFLKLKSGTDVRGIAVATEGSPVTLTDEAVYAIVCAFLKFISDKTGIVAPKIAVGNDVRISTERILKEVKRATADSGCDLVYTGLCSTPSMFMLLQNKNEGCGEN